MAPDCGSRTHKTMQNSYQPQVIIQEKIQYKERFFLWSANFWKGSLFGWIIIPWIVSAGFNGILDNSPLSPIKDIYLSTSNYYNDVALGLKCAWRDKN